MKINNIEGRITFEYGTFLDPLEKIRYLQITRRLYKLILLIDFVKPVFQVPGPVDLREESQHVRTQGIALQTQNLKSGRLCEPIPHIYHITDIRASKPTVPGAWVRFSTKQVPGSCC
jgi:hypothetical protein